MRCAGLLDDVWFSMRVSATWPVLQPASRYFWQSGRGNFPNFAVSEDGAVWGTPQHQGVTRSDIPGGLVECPVVVGSSLVNPDVLQIGINQGVAVICIFIYIY